MNLPGMRTPLPSFQLQHAGILASLTPSGLCWLPHSDQSGTTGLFLPSFQSNAHHDVIEQDGGVPYLEVGTVEIMRSQILMMQGRYYSHRR